MSARETPSDRLHPSELTKLKVLDGVSLASVQEQLESCEVKTLAQGEVLLTMGQPNDTMYMILSGKMSVHLEGGPSSDPVAFIEAGETVGELSVLDSSTASAYVVAAEETRVITVREAIFWTLVNASHDFAINLLFSLAQRLRANNSTVVTSMRRERVYKENAMSDALTGLYNRRWLEEALPRFVARYARNHKPLALLMLDVDHFKTFNDTFGHAAGDVVLVAVANSLKDNVRPGDLVARYGGEEFTVVLPEARENDAQMVAERLRKAISAMQLVRPEGGHLPPVTISIGAVAMTSEQTASELIAAADAALYESKEEGRDRVTLSRRFG